VPANDPISIFRNDAWRPNPLVDDGHYTTWRLNLDLDTRNDRESPTNGWLVHAGLGKEHQPGRRARSRCPTRSGSDRAGPVLLVENLARRPALRPAGSLGAGRRCHVARRVGRRRPAVGAARAVAGRARIILPGYWFRSMNCAPASLADPSQPALCDRLVAAQLEVRTRTRIGLPFATPDPYVTALQRLFGIREPDIVVFGDLGKSWISGSGPGRVPNDRLPVLNEWSADCRLRLRRRAAWDSTSPSR
jgi:hypothetical protein